MDRRNKPSALAATPAPPPQARVDLVGDRVTAVLPSGESVEILLTGATVLSWKGAVHGGEPAERLFLSEGAVLDGSKAVRGGIPIVFPVFGQSPADVPTSKLPQHGLARTSRWEFLGKSTSESEGKADAGAGASSSTKAAAAGSSNGVQLDFGLSAASADPALRALWPYDFALLYRVTLAPGSLATAIVVTNEGSAAFDFQVLLHTYLRVDDIAQVGVDGLAGASYLDKVEGFKEKTQAATGHVDITGETDRVYVPAQGASQPLTVLQGGRPLYGVQRDNLADVVVWNPWTEKVKSIGDFAPKDGYKNMLCVEPGSVSSWQTLEPNDAFEGAQVITLL
ncbi:glucose-6-phosphate 1-epimerase [Sporothrix schenckii 1099-18]|uniref:Glucose-6-phosphate 1-epimerase n=2 Tax=Sporothrix schenckii TaxID=29908 RepID=U7PM80_SPOS1|nr:glucose-6-phosphate 1-epimerase [Sporothrix schenckii 1099-18]ERS96677.1 hypothetical protein HMPREF1624_06886 [Sporothrix schenckii ATCC 58251]KJR81376.1 glucose-6-phosphate 1-epimerase [Sporothrix schenckii 1099-18]